MMCQAAFEWMVAELLLLYWAHLMVGTAELILEYTILARATLVLKTELDS